MFALILCMKIKNLFTLFILVLFILFQTGCSKNDSLMNFNSKNYVTLYDYQSECINYDYTLITEEDVKNIIITEMSVNEVYIEIKNRDYCQINDIVLISINDNNEYYIISGEESTKVFENSLLHTKINQSFQMDNSDIVTLIGIYRQAEISDMDFILQYYRFSTYNELEKFIRNRASDEIIFNYVYDKIIKESKVFAYPNEINNQICDDIEKYKVEILTRYGSFEYFLKEKNMTEEEFNNQIASSYYDIMIYKAILDNEGYKIKRSDIKKHINNLTDECNYFDIYKEIAYEKVREILISKTQVIK